jgi:hypothetical protein
MSRKFLVPAFIGLVVGMACLVIALCLGLPLEPLEWTWWGVVALFATILLSEAGRVELSHAAEADEDGGRYIVSAGTT